MHCDVCNKSLKKGQQKQQDPLSSKSCKLHVHSHCQDLVLTDCLTRIAESSQAAAATATVPMDKDSGQSVSELGAGEKSGIRSANSDVSRDNIRLHRLAPSVKHVKTPELQAKMEAMFASELATGSMYLVQAQINSEASEWRELANVSSKTIQTEDKQKQVAGPPAEQVEREQPQIAAVDKLVETVNRIDLQPDKAPKQPAAQRQHHLKCPPSDHRMANFTDPNRSRLCNRPRKETQLNKMDIPDHLIEAKYLIEKDHTKGSGFVELGSGQFGRVYAAISECKLVDSEKGIWSGVPVAIKEISKARFDLKQQEKLKNEASILSILDHPGVIILERVHNLEDKIYIVMEQLKDDMLEMIVSTPEKRLNERVTKFLTYQILEALRYLHQRQIAHCDLKPENVLLVDKHTYPQIKLCDFGFAKIIEENSFRCSLVGTPAYLAPEVVKGERYNQSVDLWSVGVIVYVSLSGEFPFNEGENIHDQISRASFMYPSQIWGNISQNAMNFINSLLKVNRDRRLSASIAQMDVWNQDYQLWSDLSDLELRVGKRWVTDYADYQRWSQYAKENGLRVPNSAAQLHMGLKFD